MYLKKFNPFINEKYDHRFDPLTSFRLHDTLEPEIWDNFELNKDIEEQLKKLASDYFENLDIDVELDDIWFTGSLANLNYSKYSDFDIHLVFDFSEVNDDVELVTKYLDSMKKIFEEQHDIKILGYDVELYSQDINDEHTSTGVYSLLDDKWLRTPTKKNFRPDEKLIKIKAEKIMRQIDELKDDAKTKTYEDLEERIKKLWSGIKDMRKSGIEEEGELSTENLVFKLLRRNGSISDIIELKSKLYDKQFK
jgi:hypothetical protein